MVLAFEKVITPGNVYRSLRHLKDHHAADFIFDDGATYWYATPDTDDRVRVMTSHAEAGKRKSRRRPLIVKPRSSSGYSVVKGNLSK